MAADNGFLGWLNEEERDVLMQRLTLRTYKRDEPILAESEKSFDVFFTIDGAARATSMSEDGKQVSYRDIGPGAIFGELSAIDREPRSATVVAVERMTAGRMSDSDFRDMIDTNAGLRWALLKYLASQARTMTARIFEYSTMLARDRLLQELLRMAEGVGAARGRAILQPAPTHYDLATRISTHREAVSREMSKLARLGLIEKQPRTLILTDVAELRRMRETKEQID